MRQKQIGGWVGSSGVACHQSGPITRGVLASERVGPRTNY